MFTGIIESTALVKEIRESAGNKVFLLEARIAGEFYVNQSIAHNGACLTVETVSPEKKSYQVTAIEETLKKTMLGNIHTGDRLNLERCLKAEGRIDGHFVQGHVDICGRVVAVKEHSGSRDYTVAYPGQFDELVVDRGSICINGISLTVAHTDRPKGLKSDEGCLTVSIIPHTMENTNILDWKINDAVNLEFDILGKYVQKFASVRK